MLLIDGIRYEEWTPEHEVEEFHPVIKEHLREIFGPNSFNFDANILKTEAGLGSKPDWFTLSFGTTPHWYIVEAELSSHDLYGHIVDQIGRFINGIKNVPIQKKVIEALYHEIIGEKVRKAEIEELIGSGEIYKSLSDLISRPPTLAIIIERKTPELKEALELPKYSPIEVVEFKTLVREGAGLPVHAHLFEPLYKSKGVKEGKVSRGTSEGTPLLEITVHDYFMHYNRLHIPSEIRESFPSIGTRFVLETDAGIINTKMEKGGQVWKGMGRWFKSHHELMIGDKLAIKIIEPLKQYRLEIVK